MDIREKGVTFLSSSAAVGRRAPRENNLNFILPQGTEFVDARILIRTYEVYYILLHAYMFLFFIITFINSVHLCIRVHAYVKVRAAVRETINAPRRGRGKEYTRRSGKNKKIKKINKE
jgi:hypothetical protein